MKYLLIDGYNVIARKLGGRVSDVFSSGDALRREREELIRLAKCHGAAKKDLEIRVYFDGGSDGQEFSGQAVKVLFARGPQGADRAIIRFCREHPRPREIEVATDDRSTLADHVRAFVGRVLSGDELMTRLKPSASAQRLLRSVPAGEKPALSPGDRQAINRTLPPGWFR